MLTRRDLITRTTQLGAVAALSTLDHPSSAASRDIHVNDIHSQLNSTRVRRIEKPGSIEEIRRIVRRADSRREIISIAGSRHAMGGQQFGANTVLLDMKSFNQVLRLDSKNGLIEVQAGIEWPELIDYLRTSQKKSKQAWGIRQKQTGADRLTIGGSLAANAHGRGLTYKPIIDDVESFVLVDSNGKLKTCSRRENSELFALAIGGYGLFGVISHVTLRLVPRRKVERVVRILNVNELMDSFNKRIQENYLFGDFQYAIDPNTSEFLKTGVFSCYRPVENDRPIPVNRKEFSEADWRDLITLAHTDRKRAFDLYSAHYLNTSGQIYWSDTHQLSKYLENYHHDLDQHLGSAHRASEMITEIYVPRDSLTDFLRDVRKDFSKNKVDLIYGTIRLIEKDEESFLAWAQERLACVIFNLHTEHTDSGLGKAQRDFRRLIDHAIHYKGSYFLTYHRWATRQQVETCYPQFVDFLRLKQKHDPQERFQSNWYRHYREMFADKLS